MPITTLRDDCGGPVALMIAGERREFSEYTELFAEIRRLCMLLAESRRRTWVDRARLGHVLSQLSRVGPFRDADVLRQASGGLNIRTIQKAMKLASLCVDGAGNVDLGRVNRLIVAHDQRRLAQARASMHRGSIRRAVEQSRRPVEERSLREVEEACGLRGSVDGARTSTAPKRTMVRFADEAEARTADGPKRTTVRFDDQVTLSAGNAGNSCEGVGRGAPDRGGAGSASAEPADGDRRRRTGGDASDLRVPARPGMARRADVVGQLGFDPLYARARAVREGIARARDDQVARWIDAGLIDPELIEQLADDAADGLAAGSALDRQSDGSEAPGRTNLFSGS
ncbi:MAG: hypothetical protein AAFR96_13400 [Planctomycetota bacterium]